MGKKNYTTPKKIKHKHRKIKLADLKTTVNELQKELSTLRVSKVSSGVASKLSKIKVVRKAIARSLTFINHKNRQEVKDMYKDRKALRAYNEENKTSWRFSDKPYACRERTTRAKRRALTKRQQNMKSLRAQKRADNFPQRYFAIRA